MYYVSVSLHLVSSDFLLFVPVAMVVGPVKGAALMVRTCVVDGDVTVSIRISSQMPELWNINMENSQNTGYFRKNYRKKSLHPPSVQFFVTPPTEKINKLAYPFPDNFNWNIPYTIH